MENTAKYKKEHNENITQCNRAIYGSRERTCKNMLLLFVQTNWSFV